jgi:hypothetical protein
MKLAFNIPMIFILPFAGALAERLCIRSVLLQTTWGRFIVYSVAIPLIWLFFGSDHIIKNFMSYSAALWALMVIFQLVDGTAVAFGGVLDIDYGGTDLLANQHGIQSSLDDNTRMHFNTVFEMSTSLAMIFLGPLAAVIAWGIEQHADKRESKQGVALLSDTGQAINIGVFAAIWLVLSVISIVSYSRIPKRRTKTKQVDEDKPTFAQTAKLVFADMKEAVKIFWNSRPIFWRLIFFGFEWALEDTMMAVLVFFTAEAAPWLGNHDTISTTNWTTGIIAIGKVGSLLMAAIMNKCWTPPQQHRMADYGWIFFFTFVSQASVLLLPLGYYLADKHVTVDPSTKETIYKPSDVLLGRALILLGVFLFNCLVTLPKLAFQTLLQSLVSEQDACGKVYGLVGVFCVGSSAIVPYLFTLLFERTNIQHALWVSAGLYAGFGVFQSLVGPCLVLSPAPDAGLDCEGGGTPAPSIAIAEDEGLDPQSV